MAKDDYRIGVAIDFSSDTTKIKKELRQLKEELNNLGSGESDPFKGLNIDKQLLEATNQAKEFKSIFQSAINADTGRLDLGKFNASLKQSGKTLSDYEKQFSKLGPQGQAAFSKICDSIMSAEMPLKQTNKLLNGLWENLKKTAGWTISSSIINNFTGAIQKAYGYAQDLNKSLNDIRIVTGYDTEKMAEFAKTANKAAKELSTTTTKYTDASLIYFQQGLSDEEVKARTDVTIKMANVAGESAEKVSDQMTAIWNNFSKGTDDIESFADKMTLLGAATASSVDEISDGLERFASIGNTVGLSFDYAAAALTTITAQTRESASTVGTALKTIFSRLEGLKLGETLEDGTSLNKYSAALESVGVNIKESNGALKSMDEIISELGEKWQTLEKDQQMALAETVAGTRQYTQLVALMDNFDDFKQNLTLEANAKGTLNEQADIYAESWQAAKDRVQASLEDLYSKLIKDDFFISLTDNLSKILDFVSNLVDSLGGIPGVLSVISGLVFKIFSPQITSSLMQMGQSIKDVSGATAREARQQRTEALQKKQKMLETGFAKGAGTETSSNGIELAAYNAEKTNIEMQQEYLQNYDKLTEAQREKYKSIFDENRVLKDNIEQKRKETAEIEKQNDLQKSILDFTGSKNKKSTKDTMQNVLTEDFGNKATNNFQDSLADSSIVERMKQFSPEIMAQYEEWATKDFGDNVNARKAEFESLMQAMQKEIENSEKQLSNLLDNFDALNKNIGYLNEAYPDGIIPLDEKGNFDLEQARTILDDIGKQLEETPSIELGDDFKEVQEQAKKGTLKVDDFRKALEGVKKASDEALKETTKSLKKEGKLTEEQIKALQERAENDRKIGVDTANAKQNEEKIGANKKDPSLKVGDVGASVAEGITSIGNAASSALITINSFRGVLSDLQNGDFSFTTVISSIMAVSQALDTAKKAQEAWNAIKKIGTAISTFFSTTLKVENAEEIKSPIIKKAVALAQKMSTDEKKKAIPATVGNTAVTTGEVVVENALAISMGKVIAALAILILKYVLIAAAIGAVVYGIYKLIDGSHKEEKELEKVKQSLEDSQTAYEELTERAEKFKETASNYDKVLEEFDKLDKSAENYKEKLEEINAAAKEMIETYGLFEEGDYKIENGVIKIQEQGFDKIKAQQKELDAKVKSAEQSVLMNKSALAEAEMAVNDIDVSKSIKSDKLKAKGRADTGDTDRNNTPITVQTTTNTLSVDQIKAITGAFIKLKTNNPDYEALVQEAKSGNDGAKSALEQLLLKENLDLKDTFDRTNDVIIDAITDSDLVGAFADLADSASEAADKQRYYTQQIASSLVSQQYGEQINSIAQKKNSSGETYTDEELADSINMAVTKKTLNDDKEVEEAINNAKATKSYSSIGQLNGNYGYKINDFKDLLETYGEEVRGFSKQDIENAKYDKKEKKLIGVTSTGEEFTIEKDEEDMLRELANKKAQNDAQAAALENIDQDGFLNSIEALMAKLPERAQQGFADALANGEGKLSDLLASTVNEAQLKAIQDGKLDIGDMLGINEKNWDSVFASMKELGFTSYKEFAEAMKETAINEGPAVKEAIKQSILGELAQNAAQEGFSQEEIADIQNYAEYLSEHAEALDDVNDSLQDNIDLCSKYALAQAKADKAGEEFGKVMKDNLDTLKDTSKQGTMGYVKALGSVKKAVGDLMNIEEKYLSDNFIEDNLQDIEEAATGSEEALLRLQKSAVKEMGESMMPELKKNAEEIKEKLTHKNSREEWSVMQDIWGDPDKINWEDQGNKMQSAIDTIMDSLSGFDIGSAINDESMQEACLSILGTAGMTAEKAREIFSSMGLDVEFKTKDAHITSYEKQITTEKTITHKENDPETGEPIYTMVEKPTKIEEIPVDTIVQVPDMEVNDKGGVDIQVTGSPTMSASSIKSSGGSGNSKGGGGGSSKKPKKESQEIERYHTIKQKIDDTSAAMDRLSKAKDRAFGKDQLALMDQEIAKQQELIEQTEKYSDEIDKNYAKDRAAIAAYGATFDENGNISNYESLMQRQLNIYNSSMSDAAEEAYSDFKELLDQYEETNKLRQEQRDNLQDLLNELADMKLEKIQAEVDLKVNLTENSQKILDYILDRIEERASDAAETFIKLGESIDNALVKSEAYNKGIVDILKNHEELSDSDIQKILSGDMSPVTEKNLKLTQDEVDALQEYSEQLLEVNQNIFDLTNRMQDLQLTIFNTSSETFGLLGERLEHVNSMIENYIQIYELLGKKMGKTNQEILKNLRSTQIEANRVNVANSTANLNTLKSQRAGSIASLSSTSGFSEAEIESFIAGNDAILKGLNDNQKEYFNHTRENLREMDEEIRSAEEDWASNLSDSLQTIQDILNEQIEDIVNSLTAEFNSLYGTIDELKNLLDRNIEDSQLYLADYQKIYELSKMQRNIQSQMDSAKDVRAQQKMASLAEEIAEYQKDGAKMSKQDLEYLQKKYDLRVAEIALEEAQNAKYQVQLTRDANGNYNYQFTADQNAINQAQQGYEDKLYALQDGLSSTSVNLQKTMVDEISNFENQAKTLAQSGEDPETIKAKTLDLWNSTKQRMQTYVEELKKTNSRLGNLYSTDWEWYSKMTDYKISANKDFADNFNETFLPSIFEGINSFEELETAFVTNSEKMLDEIYKKLEEAQKNSSDLLDVAGVDVEDLETVIKNKTEEMKTEIKTVENETQNLEKQFKTSFETILGYTSSFYTLYSNILDGVVTKNTGIASSIASLQNTLAENVTRIGNDLKTAITAMNEYIGVAAIAADFGGISSGVDGNGTVPGGNGVSFGGNGGTSSAAAGNSRPNVLEEFDSGGYTGNWNNSGRLAILHQKELVLNEEDTRNILDTVELVRRLSSAIDLNVINSRLGGLASLSSKSVNPFGKKEGLEQNVNIQASFPGVTDHNEIEIALSNLINDSSQYANRYF